MLLPQRVQRRNFKYNRRSFLSDAEGVNSFIDLLGHKERKLLLDNLQARLETKKTDESTQLVEDLPPNLHQLRLLFLHQLLPFVGFGFLDNLIMILAGDYIGNTISSLIASADTHFASYRYRYNDWRHAWH